MLINPIKIDVLFFIEHKDREMETAQEIILELKKTNNLKCIIASTVYHPVLAVLKYRPKIIITPSTAFGLGSPGWLFYQSFKDKPLFINLNYEQFISSWKGKYKSAKHEVSLNKQIQFTWGNYFQNFLIETRTKKENVIITGRPLFSILKKKYFGKNFKKELANTCNLDYKKNWNFIALTDGLAFVKENKILNIVNSGANEKGLRAHIDHVKGTIKEVLIWINSIKNLSNELFILRPHPSISISEYKKIILDYIGVMPSNLILSKDFTAQKWIVSSERFFTNYSTLTMDARVLEKEFYIFQPIGKLESEDYWWCNNGVNLSTFNDFKSLFNLKSHELAKYKTKQDILDFIDISKDGINETIININKQILKINYYPKFSFYFFLKALLKAPKRLFGSIIRLIFMNFKNDYFSIVKKGIKVDYFNINKTNNDL